VNRNIKAAIFIFFAILLSSCSKKISSPYSLNSFNCNDTVSENEAFYSDGFANDLCVPNDISLISTSQDNNTYSYGTFLIDECNIKDYREIYKKVYPASTTKIMTCLLALEHLNLDDKIKIEDDVSISVYGSSMAGLSLGDEMTVRDLLYGLMLPSGNDAALEVANLVAGNVPDFVIMMNEKSKELGATKTNFTNPHGLPDENHYSTVYDMYLIFNEACKNIDFLAITSSKEYTATITNSVSSNENSKREVTWKNTNGFLSGKYMYDESVKINAGKTGHTNAAGYCLVLNTENAGKTKISIIMKAESADQLYNSMKSIIK